jgi:hypothetical protein
MPAWFHAQFPTYGVYGEVAIVPTRALAAYPDNLSVIQATSIWMQYLTAYGSLVDLGKVTAGDFVLIPGQQQNRYSGHRDREGKRRNQYRYDSHRKEEGGASQIRR